MIDIVYYFYELSSSEIFSVRNLGCPNIFISVFQRCVVMVGLPYPNIHSPELKEYMSYLDTTLGVCISCFRNNCFYW